MLFVFFFFFQAEDGIRDLTVTGVQTCALPICAEPAERHCGEHEEQDRAAHVPRGRVEVEPEEHAAEGGEAGAERPRSEEHTSELQSQSNIVCRLLLEKKKRSDGGNPGTR